jgi:surfeit locus 1 family protein
MPIKFRFRWIPFLAMTLAVTVGVMLGQWQTRRAATKEAIESKLNLREAAPPMAIGNATLTAQEVEYRRVTLQGEFDPDWAVYLDNRPMHGQAGFYVLMPLKIARSDMHVLVLRGWLPRDPKNRAAIPAYETPSGLVEVHGFARRNLGQLLELGNAAPLRPRAIMQNVTPAQFAAASGLKVQPFVVEQSNNVGDQLVRDWPRPSLGIDKHRGYAFQWYALAATAFFFFIATGFRRGPG